MAERKKRKKSKFEIEELKDIEIDDSDIPVHEKYVEEEDLKE